MYYQLVTCHKFIRNSILLIKDEFYHVSTKTPDAYYIKGLKILQKYFFNGSWNPNSEFIGFGQLSLSNHYFLTLKQCKLIFLNNST